MFFNFSNTFLNMAFLILKIHYKVFLFNKYDCYTCITQNSELFISLLLVSCIKLLEQDLSVASKRVNFYLLKIKKNYICAC